MSNWTFHVLTFGCKVNQYESEALRQAWAARGGIETDEPECADFILVNSCAITGRAERNCRNAIFRLRKKAPFSQIILTGCAAQFYLDFRPRKNANWTAPDLCVPQKDKFRLYAGPMSAPGQAASWHGIAGYGRSRPVIKIQDGCSQNCSYCIVPATRGLPVSRNPDEIIAECRLMATKGYGELVISGVNLRQYRHDFWQLITTLDRELAPEFGDSCRLRISSLDPGLLTGRGLDAISSCRMLCPHLHLSLQHASPKILAAMRRPAYTADSVLDLCAKLAGIWPVMGLGADIIAGFPGEDETDLGLLLDFIAASNLTYGHVFPYSVRQGTKAAVMPGQIARSEKIRRSERIRAAIEKKTGQFLSKQLSLPVMDVVTDAPRPGKAWHGVNEFYATCVLDCEAQCSSGLIKTRPVGLSAAGLVVRPLA